MSFAKVTELKPVCMFTAWSIKLLEVHIIPIECHIVCFSSSATGMFYFPVHCKCLTAIRLDLPEKNNLSRIIHHFYFHENFFFSTPKLSRDVPSSEIWRVCAAASRGGCKLRRSQKQSNTERDHFCELLHWPWILYMQRVPECTNRQKSPNYSCTQQEMLWLISCHMQV